VGMILNRDGFLIGEKMSENYLKEKTNV
jgi:hypothetical protein